MSIPKRFAGIEESIREIRQELRWSDTKHQNFEHATEKEVWALQGKVEDLNGYIQDLEDRVAELDAALDKPQKITDTTS